MQIKIQIWLLEPLFFSYFEASLFRCFLGQDSVSRRLLGCKRTTPDMLTRNKLRICNTSLYGLSAGSSNQRSISQQAWPPYHIPSRVQLSWAAIFGSPDGDKLLALCFNATSTQPMAPFSLLCFKEFIPSSLIYQRSFCCGSQYKINHKSQQFIDPVGPHRQHRQQSRSFQVACHWANYEKNFSFGFCPKTVL